MKSLIIIFLAVTLAVALEESLDNPERIINGKPAAPGQFPYQVHLGLKNGSEWNYCGGSLISWEWVLTAAHCVYNIDYAEVRLGLIYFDKPELSVKGDEIIIHEEYDDPHLCNDIALIRIPPVKFTDNIQKIKLPKKPYPKYVGKKVTVMGWGDIDDCNTMPDSLLYAEMVGISNKDCNKVYGTINRSRICASPFNGSNICGGDSGGPMTLSDSKILIGVTSFGSVECEDGSPSVFTRVTSYLDWIAKNTGIEY